MNSVNKLNLSVNFQQLQKKESSTDIDSVMQEDNESVQPVQSAETSVGLIRLSSGDLLSGKSAHLELSQSLNSIQPIIIEPDTENTLKEKLKNLVNNSLEKGFEFNWKGAIWKIEKTLNTNQIIQFSLTIGQSVDSRKFVKNQQGPEVQFNGLSMLLENKLDGYIHEAETYPQDVVSQKVAEFIKDHKSADNAFASLKMKELKIEGYNKIKLKKELSKYANNNFLPDDSRRNFIQSGRARNKLKSSESVRLKKVLCHLSTQSEEIQKKFIQTFCSGAQGFAGQCGQQEDLAMKNAIDRYLLGDFITPDTSFLGKKIVYDYLKKTFDTWFDSLGIDSENRGVAINKFQSFLSDGLVQEQGNVLAVDCQELKFVLKDELQKKYTEDRERVFEFLKSADIYSANVAVKKEGEALLFDGYKDIDTVLVLSDHSISKYLEKIGVFQVNHVQGNKEDINAVEQVMAAIEKSNSKKKTNDVRFLFESLTADEQRRCILSSINNEHNDLLSFLLEFKPQLLEAHGSEFLSTAIETKKYHCAGTLIQLMSHDQVADTEINMVGKSYRCIEIALLRREDNLVEKLIRKMSGQALNGPCLSEQNKTIFSKICNNDLYLSWMLSKDDVSINSPGFFQQRLNKSDEKSIRVLISKMSQEELLASSNESQSIFNMILKQTNPLFVLDAIKRCNLNTMNKKVLLNVLIKRVPSTELNEAMQYVVDQMSINDFQVNNVLTNMDDFVTLVTYLDLKGEVSSILGENTDVGDLRNRLNQNWVNMQQQSPVTWAINNKKFKLARHMINPLSAEDCIRRNGRGESILTALKNVDPQKLDTDVIYNKLTPNEMKVLVFNDIEYFMGYLKNKSQEKYAQILNVIPSEYQIKQLAKDNMTTLNWAAGIKDVNVIDYVLSVLSEDQIRAGATQFINQAVNNSNFEVFRQFIDHPKVNLSEDEIYLVINRCNSVHHGLKNDLISIVKKRFYKQAEAVPVLHQSKLLSSIMENAVKKLDNNQLISNISPTSQTMRFEQLLVDSVKTQSWSVVRILIERCPEESRHILFDNDIVFKWLDSGLSPASAFFVKEREAVLSEFFNVADQSDNQANHIRNRYNLGKVMQWAANNQFSGVLDYLSGLIPAEQKKDKLLAALKSALNLGDLNVLRESLHLLKVLPHQNCHVLADKTILSNAVNIAISKYKEEGETVTSNLMKYLLQNVEQNIGLLDDTAKAQLIDTFKEVIYPLLKSNYRVDDELRSEVLKQLLKLFKTVNYSMQNEEKRIEMVNQDILEMMKYTLKNEDWVDQSHYDGGIVNILARELDSQVQVFKKLNKNDSAFFIKSFALTGYANLLDSIVKNELDKCQFDLREKETLKKVLKELLIQSFQYPYCSFSGSGNVCNVLTKHLSDESVSFQPVKDRQGYSSKPINRSGLTRLYLDQNAKQKLDKNGEYYVKLVTKEGNDHYSRRSWFSTSFNQAENSLNTRGQLTETIRNVFPKSAFDFEQDNKRVRVTDRYLFKR